jgi:hypothetical protein
MADRAMGPRAAPPHQSAPLPRLTSFQAIQDRLSYGPMEGPLGKRALLESLLISSSSILILTQSVVVDFTLLCVEPHSKL